MLLSNGTHFGPYEILSPLGAGGMGEVYRGRDGKLGRDVALKVLPESLAGDVDYINRFHREAQVLAALNHPHIAAIYGMEGRAIVMELVDGTTLAERIALGPIPMDESLAIARQISDALEYAHEKGVIHRDLKPANVKITPDGVVKVLDFGLAKIVEGPTSQGNPATSPTLTVRAATHAGVILGTAAYMAPEQARGHAVDRRGDIWAFGAVLYEMITGKMAFPGDNITDILASVVKLEPEWNELPRSTPPVIRKLIARCLAKDRKRRLQAIGEARLAIEDHLADPVAGTPSIVAPALVQPARRPWPWIALAAVLFVALAALALIHFRESPPAERVLRYSIPTPEKSQIHTFALSPDGRYLAIAAEVEGKRLLWVRPLDSTTTQELRGTDEAQYPFWSFDSRSIGFFAGGKLKKIAVEGGPPQILCDAPEGRSGTWNRDGVIVFAPTNHGPLQRVAATGGVPVDVTKVAGAEIHRFPIFLPDGRHFLYLASLGSEQSTGIFAGSLDGQPPRRVVADQSSALWLPHSTVKDSGYLLFHRDRTLMAQPFDPRTLQPAGDLFPVTEQLSIGNRNYVQASVSSNGILVSWNGGSMFSENQLSWYDRSGKVLSNVGTPARMFGLTLSPDEKTVAISRRAAAGSDIWLLDAVRGVDTRFTFDSASSRGTIWSPDGRRIVYSPMRKSAKSNIFIKDASGSGQEEMLLPPPDAAGRYACDWSKDGRTLLFAEESSSSDLWVMNMEDRKATPFLVTAFNESQGKFSPDGRWVAYVSDESGRYEVYVRPFAEGGGKWKLSTNGGQLPSWRRDGKEIFYLTLDRKLMAAAVKAGSGAQPALSVESPQLLFNTRAPGLIPGFVNYTYAAAADGKRFLAFSVIGDTASAPLQVVVNVIAAVKKQ